MGAARACSDQEEVVEIVQFVTLIVRRHRRRIRTTIPRLRDDVPPLRPSNCRPSGHPGSSTRDSGSRIYRVLEVAVSTQRKVSPPLAQARDRSGDPAGQLRRAPADTPSTPPPAGLTSPKPPQRSSHREHRARGRRPMCHGARSVQRSAQLARRPTRALRRRDR